MLFLKYNLKMDQKSNDTWSDIQAFKMKQNSLREKMQRRKREREGLVAGLSSANINNTPLMSNSDSNAHVTTSSSANLSETLNVNKINIDEVEKKLLQYLCDAALKLPIDSRSLTSSVSKICQLDFNGHEIIQNLLQKFAFQELIAVEESITADSETCLVIQSADHSKLITFASEVGANVDNSDREEEDSSHPPKRRNDGSKTNDSKSESEDILESLLALPSIREKENKKMGEEILELLSKPTAKERSLVERFRSVGGGQVQEFCPHGTTDECKKISLSTQHCSRLHFKKIIQAHTDESLGDCSFLNTCFHMDTCKYVHYEVDYSTLKTRKEIVEQSQIIQPTNSDTRFKSILYPAQWIRCDLRYFDMSTLGKFSVVMADPPWDIHMELPYGTMSDDEMRNLGVPCLQDEGLIFLWVTGRAMELGRECLQLWGYERCDEIIWVKTNQLQRIIRTGRTGHWINHGKEHCLVGVKGNPTTINRGLDCDVIVAEVRATSHKPDEIYGIIERLSPGTRKIELFGRQHNTQPNWVTLGNQLDGVRVLDPELAEAYRKRYPEEAEKLMKESSDHKNFRKK